MINNKIFFHNAYIPYGQYSIFGDKIMAFRKRIFGKTLVVNLNAKRGYRISPGVNGRAAAIRDCAKGKSLAARKDCFRMGSHKGRGRKATPE